MPSFSIEPRGSYSLQASKDFLRGFTPASGSSADEGEQLSLAFLSDEKFEPSLVTLNADGKSLRAESKSAGVKAQVERILSLDVDGTKFDAMVKKDPVLKKLRDAFPGFRPVCFSSPYEAAVWGILAQRVPMKMASAVKRKLAEAHGTIFKVGDAELVVLPPPQTLIKTKAFPSVPAQKWERLQAIAGATLEGKLDVERLRALDPEEAMAQLAELPGVGAWTAGHILIRGCGTPDILPLDEPRVKAGAELALGRPLTDAQFVQAAEAWRPFRTWVSVMLVMLLRRQGDWNAPGKRGGRKLKAPSKQKSLPLK